MQYVIRASNIAPLVRVEGPRNFEIGRYIYMADDKPVEASGYPASEPPFGDLPPEVQEEINRWVAEVFALPVEERGAWVKSKADSSVTVTRSDDE